MVNTLNNLLIHVQFLYFGLVKKGLDFETKEVNDQMTKEIEMKDAAEWFKIKHYKKKSITLEE